MRETNQATTQTSNMLGDLQTRAVEVGLEMLFKQVVEVLRSKPWSFLQRRRAATIVRTVGAKLDDLVLDLQPLFEPREHTSILQVFYGSGPNHDESWNRVHEVLNVLGASFRDWDAMRLAIGTRRTPEILIRQFESLDTILEYLGLFVAREVGRRFESLPLDHHARVSFRVAADRYNRFLTEYEALLRRLPQEVGIEPSPLGGEHFFIRL